jgi:hypothetical protein
VALALFCDGFRNGWLARSIHGYSERATGSCGGAASAQMRLKLREAPVIN